MRVLVAHISYRIESDDYQVTTVHREPHESEPGTTTLTSGSLDDCLAYVKRKHDKQTQIDMCGVLEERIRRLNDDDDEEKEK